MVVQRTLRVVTHGLTLVVVLEAGYACGGNVVVDPSAHGVSPTMGGTGVSVCATFQNGSRAVLQRISPADKGDSVPYRSRQTRTRFRFLSAHARQELDRGKGTEHRPVATRDGTVSR
jgi:hypothetical protein